MTSVTIPDSVKTIGEAAFWTCVSLKSVTIPNSLTIIGSGSFLSCGLTSLTIPDSVTTIGDSAFDGCDMTSLTIPSSVTSIGDQAFVGCINLKSVTIKNPKCKLGRYITLGSGIIYGYDGSTAEAFAKENDYAFKSLNLAAPKLSGVSNTAAGVKLTWGAVSGAAKYRVYYKTGSGSWTKIADTTSTSYTWTKAKSGTKYTFTVRAYDKEGVAGRYDKTGLSVTYVAAPTVKISNAANGIKVTWNKVAGASRYAVYYKVGNGGWTKIGTTTATSYTWTKAVSGKTYAFTVRCTNAKKVNISAYKASNSLKYVAAPTVKIAAAANGIKVTWNKVAGASRYTVYYKEGSGGWHKIGTTKGASTSYTWTKAVSGKTYAFTVRAADANKKLLSGYKASNSLKYVAAPTVTIAKASNGIKVTWNKVAGASRYALYYKVGSGGWTKIGTTTATSYTWKKAVSGKTYAFTVRCTNANRVNISAYKASNSLKYSK